MADVTVVAASVVAGSGAKVEHGTAGATITQGKVVYRDSTDGKYKLANAVTSSTTATVYGIALNSASDTQALSVATEGDITVGGLTAGEVYVLSGAASGGIAPAADLTAGTTWRCSILGGAISSTVLRLKINNTDTVNA